MERANFVDSGSRKIYSGISVNYDALSFVNSKVGGSNALESNISRALYAYWQAAEALLG